MAKQQLTPEQHAKFSRVGKSNVRTGKAYERRVAHLLTDWSGVPFRRRRVEGRESAVRVMELVADVIPCVGDFHFAVECKKGKDFSLDNLMSNPAGSLFTTWWHQACYDAQLISKDMDRAIYPMLFFKPHPNWDWIAISALVLSKLTPKANAKSGGDVATAMAAGVDGTLWFPHLKFDHFSTMGPVEGDISHSKKNKKLVSIDLDPVIMCRWRDFEANVWPSATFANFPTADELAKITDKED